MSDADRDKWQGMYESGRYEPRTQASPLLEEWLPRLPRGRALDIACGVGRHALRLAEAGYAVDAIDIAPAALAIGRATAAGRGLAIDWQAADIDAFDPPPGRYDVVVCARYVNRLLMPRLPTALTPGGWLLFEHHLRTSLEVNGPRDAGFRLAPNELLTAFPGLRVVHYREQVITDPNGMRMAVAQLVACNGDAGL
ncbi:MAG: class I SAM-dependent methyltransferase [Planctomycetes bacterium]|nr:class I SAM-dependent methyltransferase [Planctomycetota bacterium]